jgi:hypothetical protein
MTTIVIDERSIEAKKMVEFLKTQRFAKVFDEKEPTESLLEAMKEAKEGKVTKTKNFADLLQKLKS